MIYIAIIVCILAYALVRDNFILIFFAPIILILAFLDVREYQEISSDKYSIILSMHDIQNDAIHALADGEITVKEYHEIMNQHRKNQKARIKESIEKRIHDSTTESAQQPVSP